MKPSVSSDDNNFKRRNVVDKLPDLFCRVKYSNSLPDLPFDTKFIMYPFQHLRFVHYKPTSLERSYKYDIMTEPDLGVHIDLVNKDIYSNYTEYKLDSADEKLLEEDGMTFQDNKRSQHHARSVSWLRRTEYISTEQTRFQPQSADKVEARVGFMTRKNLTYDDVYMDRQSQIAAIEKTFENSQIILSKHYSKPNVTCVEILPIFPDFKMWKHSCAEVIFDSDPACFDTSLPRKIETMSQALIRGVVDEKGQQFVALFLPQNESLLDKNKMVETDQYQYRLIREYNWKVKNKTCKTYEETYVFIVREDGVFYNELETKVNLNKRRQKGNNNSKLMVKYRPFTTQELNDQMLKVHQLNKIIEDEEDTFYKQDGVTEQMLVELQEE